MYIHRVYVYGRGGQSFGGSFFSGCVFRDLFVFAHGFGDFGWVNWLLSSVFSAGWNQHEKQTVKPWDLKQEVNEHPCKLVYSYPSFLHRFHACFGP